MPTEEKMLAYLSGLYSDKSQWEQRREILRKEVRQRLGLDDMLGENSEGKVVGRLRRKGELLHEGKL